MKQELTDRMLRHADEVAREHVRSDREVSDVDRMWCLFAEAVKTERSLPCPPPMSRAPSRAAWPDYPDEVSYYARIMLAIARKEPLDEAQGAPPRIPPSAARMTRHDVVMFLWHRYALRTSGNWRHQRKALWAYAAGKRNGAVCREYGLTRTGLARLKRRAMLDMQKGVAKSQIWG